MNNLLLSCKKFINRNGSTILTTIGGVGVVATTVMAVKATPKAVQLLEEAELQKDEPLTVIDKIKVAGPIYIPTIITGVATIACIFGANVLNKRHQASLMSAYALLDKTFKDYRNKVNELYGEDADKHVRDELAKDSYEDTPVEPEDNKVLFYDEYSQRYFNATMEDVLNAEYTLNRDLAYHGYLCLNEFYDLLGLEHTDFGDILGWSHNLIYEHQWYSWIEFNHRKVKLEDHEGGLECYILEILTEPIPEFDEY